MSKLSKKALFVKRSEAAKRGWETRRAKQGSTNQPRSGSNARPKSDVNRKGNTTTPARKPSNQQAQRRKPKSKKNAPKRQRAESKSAKITRLEKENKRLLQKEKRRESRERTEIRKANQAALKAIESTETMIANMARNGVPIRNILRQVPVSGQQHAKEIIVQTRLDMAAQLYEDVRWEAFDLADELDWDISDVFDAWSYDEGTAA